MIRINLISSPRNLSTALMYSFGNRPDTSVVDEPLYAAYLKITGKIHPGHEEVLATQDTDPLRVLDHLRSVETGKDILFIKNMAHHMAAVGDSCLEGFRHVFLIRHPAEMITSFTQVIEKPVLQDVGIADQWQLWKSLENEGSVVVHADDIRNQPRQTLSRLCAAIGIPFDAAMLDWPAGPKPFDGTWAPFWYGGVHASTGFKPVEPREIKLESWQTELLDQTLTYYMQLLKEKI